MHASMQLLPNEGMHRSDSRKQLWNNGKEEQLHVISTIKVVVRHRTSIHDVHNVPVVVRRSPSPL
jgi:hypothetical protein